MLVDGSNVSGRLAWVIFSAENTVTWPSGWTEFFAGSTTSTVLRAAYRFIDGTEGFDGTDDSITVTTSSAVLSNAHAYLSKSGHHASTAPEAATAATGSGANANSPTFDPAGWASEETLWVPAAAYRFGANFTVAPTNYIGLLSLNGGDSNAPLGSARRALTASSEDPGTFTSDDGGAWVATTIAIRPAAAGGSVALDGDTEVVVELDGDIGVTRLLGGDTEVVVEADGGLSVSKLVEGDADIVVGLAGGLSATKPISGKFNVSTKLTGDLTVTPPGGAAVPLDGSLAAVAEADGDLSVAKLVDGNLGAIVGLAGDLTVTPPAGGVELDGTVGVVVGLAGELSVTQGLAGEIDLVVELAGDLAVPTSHQLEGTVEVVVGVGPLAELFVQRPQGVAPRRLWRTSRVY
jgi:hypothetical protein